MKKINIEYTVYALLFLLMIIGAVILFDIANENYIPIEATDYWNIEYDTNYFVVSYSEAWIEFGQDTQWVNLTVMNLNITSNYQLNFNGENFDLTGFSKYTKTFKITLLGFAIERDNYYREFTAILQEWNTTIFNYQAIAKASMLRTEGNKQDVNMVDFPFVTPLATVSLIVVVKKRKR